MIPKIIHYCWFGHKKNKTKDDYIKNWKKQYPDFQIIEWNENNFPIEKFEYVKEAYKEKKYAFVSDVARLFALYQYGGIYMDTDVEILKDFYSVLSSKINLGLEKKGTIMSAVIASEKNNYDILCLLNSYTEKKFTDENGNLDLTPNTIIFSKYFKDKYKLNLNNELEQNEFIKIFPIDYFCGYNLDLKKVCTTDNTFTIHHYNATWYSFFGKIKKKISIIIRKLFGEKIYKKLRRK